MLVSLSLTHMNGLSFPSHRAMVDHMRMHSLSTHDAVGEYLHAHPRIEFTGGIEQIEYLPCKLKEGGEVTNILMQGILLDVFTSCVLGGKGRWEGMVKVVDVGCGTGAITLGMGYVLERVLDKGKEFKVIGVDMDKKAIELAMQTQKRLKYDANKINFGVADFFTLLNTERNFDIILMGIGVTHTDVLTILMLNGGESTILIAPVFETSTQQALSIYCPTSHLSSLTSALSVLPLFTLSTRAINDDYSVVRVMSCFFSPMVTVQGDPLGNEAKRQGSDDHDILSMVQALGGDTRHKGNDALRDRQFRYMDKEGLEKILAEREIEFKKYFLAEKKKNPNYSLKDVQAGEYASRFADIAEIKRILRLKFGPQKSTDSTDSTNSSKP